MWPLGKRQLAFVSLLSTDKAPKAIGQTPLLLVLRKQDTGWLLLVASTEPISNKRFLRQIPSIAGQLQRPKDESDKPQPAELLSPLDGQEPLPELGQRFGGFTWSPSRSESVVAEVVEFAYQGDARLFLETYGRQQPTGRISAGELWHTRSEWKSPRLVNNRHREHCVFAIQSVPALITSLAVLRLPRPRRSRSRIRS